MFILEMAADLAEKTEVSDVALLDSDSAAALVVSIGAETAVATMNQDSLGAMVGALEAEIIPRFLHEGVAGQLVGARAGENPESLGPDQATCMANAMDDGQISE